MATHLYLDAQRAGYSDVANFLRDKADAALQTKSAEGQSRIAANQQGYQQWAKYNTGFFGAVKHVGQIENAAVEGGETGAVQFAKGGAEAVVDTVKGVVGMAVHPVDTAVGIGHAAAHPITTGKAVVSSVVQTAKDVASGDPEKIGKAITNLALMVLPGAGEAGAVEKAAGAIEKVEKAAGALEKVEKAANALEKAEKTAGALEKAEKAGGAIEKAEKAGGAIEKTADETAKVVKKTDEAVGAAKSPEITPNDLAGKTPDEIRQLAKDKGLVPDPVKPDKWRDPVTGKERLRIDPGHIDKNTGLPYNDPNAAVPHQHGYGPTGPKNPVVDPVTGNPHFPSKLQ